MKIPWQTCGQGPSTLRETNSPNNLSNKSLSGQPFDKRVGPNCFKKKSPEKQFRASGETPALANTRKIVEHTGSTESVTSKEVMFYNFLTLYSSHGYTPIEQSMRDPGIFIRRVQSHTVLTVQSLQ